MTMKSKAIKYIPIERRHLDGIIRLCEAEPWPSYIKDPGFTWRILTAPGVHTLVAEENEEVIGFVQMQTDGGIQAHLSLILIARNRRREGIGSRLICEAFARSGAERVDLITEDAPDFYRSFAHKEWYGFRIYPQYDKEAAQQCAAQASVPIKSSKM